ncbi:MAG: hypothetical protein ABJG47_08695 [Ekhidna sp.]
MSKNLYHVVITILVVFTTSCGNSNSEASQSEVTLLDAEYSNKLYSEIALKVEGGDSSINLTEVFDFDWNKLIIPKAYSNLESIKKEYKGMNKQIERIKYDDARSLLLFAKDDQIIKYIFLSNVKSNFSSIQEESVRIYERGESQFMIDVQVNKNGKTSTRLRPLKE